MKIHKALSIVFLYTVLNVHSSYGSVNLEEEIVSFFNTKQENACLRLFAKEVKRTVTSDGWESEYVAGFAFTRIDAADLEALESGPISFGIANNKEVVAGSVEIEGRWVAKACPGFSSKQFAKYMCGSKFASLFEWAEALQLPYNESKVVRRELPFACIFSGPESSIPNEVYFRGFSKSALEKIDDYIEALSH